MESATLIDEIVAASLSTEQGSFYFKLFRITPRTSVLELKRCYKRWALTIHPDKCKHANAAIAFAELQKGYQLTQEFLTSCTTQQTDEVHSTTHKYSTRESCWGASLRTPETQSPPPPPPPPPSLPPPPSAPPIFAAAKCAVTFPSYRSQLIHRQNDPKDLMHPGKVPTSEMQPASKASDVHYTLPPLSQLHIKSNETVSSPVPELSPVASIPVPPLESALAPCYFDGTEMLAKKVLNPNSPCCADSGKQSTLDTEKGKEDDRDMIRFRCPWCYADDTAEEEDIDLPTLCVKCGATFVLKRKLCGVLTEEVKENWTIPSTPADRLQLSACTRRDGEVVKHSVEPILCPCGSALAGRCVFCDSEDESETS